MFGNDNKKDYSDQKKDQAYKDRNPFTNRVQKRQVFRHLKDECSTNL